MHHDGYPGGQPLIHSHSLGLSNLVSLMKSSNSLVGVVTAVSSDRPLLIVRVT